MITERSDIPDGLRDRLAKIAGAAHEGGLAVHADYTRRDDARLQELGLAIIRGNRIRLTEAGADALERAA